MYFDLNKYFFFKSIKTEKILHMLSLVALSSNYFLITHISK